eukprot:6321911-Pyramimonas_sp.AAC.1
MHIMTQSLWDHILKSVGREVMPKPPGRNDLLLFVVDALADTLEGVALAQQRVVGMPRVVVDLILDVRPQRVEYWASLVGDRGALGNPFLELPPPSRRTPRAV